MKLMVRLVTLVVLLMPFVIRAQTVTPGMTLHRSQAGELDSTGWVRASSSKGNFSVRLPCSFNDFTVQHSDPGTTSKRADVVGCARPDQTRFVATRLQYQNGAEARAYFEKVKRDYDKPEQKMLAMTVDGAPAFDIELNYPLRCAISRMIHAFPVNYLLIAEGIGDGCKGLKALARPFFDSLQIGGR